MSDWSIKRGELKCEKCSRDFANEEEYYSALYDEERQFVRRDYCLECWDGHDEERMFSFWKTRVPDREEERKVADDEVVMNFFMRLQGETDPMKVNFRYVLALLLMRKRVFKLDDIRYDEKGEALVLKQRGEDKEVIVYNPELTEEQIAQVTEEVGQILNVTV